MSKMHESILNDVCKTFSSVFRCNKKKGSWSNVVLFAAFLVTATVRDNKNAKNRVSEPYNCVVALNKFVTNNSAANE